MPVVTVTVCVKLFDMFHYTVSFAASADLGSRVGYTFHQVGQTHSTVNLLTITSKVKVVNKLVT
jgi:hypothetical protein